MSDNAIYSSVIDQISTDRKVVAFTFDDGPNPLYTAQILDIFRKSASKATFFMIGNQIEQHPEVAKAVFEQGHEIANHTYSHPYLTTISEQDCINELLRTHEIIMQTTGVKPLTFRAPYFDMNEQVVKASEQLGYQIIGAVNGDAKDWEQPGVQYIVDNTIAHVKPGSVLLFHDGFGDRSQTVEAVQMLVTELKAQGYELVTVSDMILRRD
ncbi:MAG: polysaccharide deacetylase family protein [Candidatus Cohnella colombiensis]|uniref:Polysaccharide deacetylase family protein n=1 Tax=Candidatus Cohnella colombiensis TaxID=3121368 RepID=A0AA95EUR1_9BACL|nr:MAG: polysaccharide deacetylase family protein [Cohnella sp.]